MELGAKARVDAARDRQHRPDHAEDEDEEQPPEEIGDGERQRNEAVDQPLRQPPPEIGAEKGKAGAEDDGDEDGDEHQLQRRREAREDQGHHVLAAADRGAEIADRDLLQPDDELVEDGKVEAVVRHQPIDIGLARAGRDHHRDRVAGHDAQQHEDDDGDAEQRRRDEEQTAENCTSTHTPPTPDQGVQETRTRTGPQGPPSCRLASR